jgi:hypothetical protein
MPFTPPLADQSPWTPPLKKPQFEPLESKSPLFVHGFGVPAPRARLFTIHFYELAGG